MAESIAWKKIERFIGYGNLNAAVAFVGMEESLDSEASLDDDLLARSQYSGDVVDLRFGGQESVMQFQRTWKVMCDLMIRRKGENPSYGSRMSYQAESLGKEGGDTLIAELLPYPRKNRRGPWPYEESYQDYRKRVLPDRIKALEAALFAVERELIVFHGKQEIESFKEIAGDCKWTRHGSFECTVRDSAHVVIAPQLSTKAFNSDLQLEAFADFALRRGHEHYE
jgi:hypothetical protein